MQMDRRLFLVAAAISTGAALRAPHTEPEPPEASAAAIGKFRDANALFADQVGKCGAEESTERAVRSVGMESSSNKYARDRAGLVYYSQLYCMVHLLGKGAKSIVDVGSSDPPFLRSFPQIAARHLVSPYFAGENRSRLHDECHQTCAYDGMKLHVADFMTWRPPESFDVVLCSQVLEHVDDPTAFLRKLLTTGRTVIVSVPYKWHDEENRFHKSHFIDVPTVVGWAGRMPIAMKISNERKQRLIMAFNGTSAV